MCLDRVGITIPDSITATNLLTTVKSLFTSLSGALAGDVAKYRQELRDITKQENFPYSVEFPVKPSVSIETSIEELLK
jgi:hypothetical protein